MALSPSKAHVLRALSQGKGPLSQAALCAGTNAHKDTIRDARKALQADALIEPVGTGAEITYRLTEGGVVLARTLEGTTGGTTQGPPQGTTHPTPHLASRALLSKSNGSNEESAAAAAREPDEEATLEDQGPPQGPPHEAMEAVEALARCVRRLERQVLAKDAANELLLARIAELERRLGASASKTEATKRVSPEKPGSQPGGASPPRPQTAPDEVSVAGTGSSGRGPAEAAPTEAAASRSQPGPQDSPPTHPEIEEALQEELHEEKLGRVVKGKEPIYNERRWLEPKRKELKSDGKRVREAIARRRARLDLEARSPAKVVPKPAVPMETDQLSGPKALAAIRAAEERQRAERAKQKIQENAVARRAPA